MATCCARDTGRTAARGCRPRLAGVTPAVVCAARRLGSKQEALAEHLEACLTVTEIQDFFLTNYVRPPASSRPPARQQLPRVITSESCSRPRAIARTQALFSELSQLQARSRPADCTRGAGLSSVLRVRMALSACPHAQNSYSEAHPFSLADPLRGAIQNRVARGAADLHLQALHAVTVAIMRDPLTHDWLQVRAVSRLRARSKARKASQSPPASPSENAR